MTPREIQRAIVVFDPAIHQSSAAPASSTVNVAETRRRVDLGSRSSEL